MWLWRSCYRFPSLVCLVDDTAIRHPGDSKWYKEHQDAFDFRVDFHNVRRTVLRRTASSDDVSPDEHRTVQSDTQCPHTTDAQWCLLCREKASTHFLQTQQPVLNETSERKISRLPITTQCRELWTWSLWLFDWCVIRAMKTTEIIRPTRCLNI